MYKNNAHMLYNFVDYDASKKPYSKTNKLLLSKRKLRMMLNKKVLIIAYPFPPIPYSGTYRLLRLAKGLAKKDIEIHALSIKIDKRIPNDYELLSKLPSTVNIHRTQIIDPWQRYKKWKKKGKSKNGIKRYIRKFVSLIFQLINIPDHQILWIPFAFIKAIKIIKKHEIRNIIISSPPVSSLLTGCLLKIFCDVNFIADLRDPIVGNIADVNLINPKKLFDKMQSMALKQIEKIVVKSADIVVANTLTHCRESQQIYKTGKFITIRNAFDQDDYKELQVKKFDKFTVSHLGGIYGLRKADVLFRALKLLEKEVMPEELKLQTLFVGTCDHRFKQSVVHHEVEKYVTYIPRVSHNRALEIMFNSNLLLLVKATGKGSLGQIPAKFYEYIGTKNRIICIGPEKSEVALLIDEAGVGITVEKNDKKLSDFLKILYDEFLINGFIRKNDSNIIKYNYGFMVSEFIKLLR